MTARTPEGYLGTEGRINSGPSEELVATGYALELADAPLLHRGLGLADLAHVVALHEAGVVPDDAARALLHELLDLLDTPAEDFPYDPVYGDAYNSRERELERRLGPRAGWLHTGRTRREAGRIAFRLALRGRALDLAVALAAFVDAVGERADDHAETVWNDTTYLQPAQPSTFGHYLLTFAEEAVRDIDRAVAIAGWADVSPGGVGGVNGTRIPLDRARLAELLGFSRVGAHSRDVMWSVDGVVDAGVAAVQAAMTTSRLAEDLEIMTSPPYGFVELDASVCRASVMLPQKRNPYGLSVIRAGANNLLGTATGLMATRRTPSARTDNWLHAYGEATGGMEAATDLVRLATATVATLDVDVERLAATAGDHFTAATDLADELVLQAGLDYRTAYRLVGRVAAAAHRAGRTRFTDEDVAAICDAAASLGGELDAEVLAATLDPAAVVATRTSEGGAAPSVVRSRVATLRGDAADRARAASSRQEAGARAEAALVDLAGALAASD